MRVGKDYDLKRLGHMIYMSNHTENGFPQNYTHFIPAENEDPEIAAYVASVNGYSQDAIELHGSMSDQGIRAYYANPLEVDWGSSISWSKEYFKGKESLLKLRNSKSTRSVCILEWNPKDILNIFRAFYGDDPDVPDEMAFPQNYFFACNGNLSDKVLNETGKMIGRSTGIVYTPYYKKTITQAYILPEYNEIGKEVTILWGTAGTRQIPIRANIARFPYLDLPSNRTYDMESIPRYKPE